MDDHEEQSGYEELALEGSETPSLTASQKAQNIREINDHREKTRKEYRAMERNIVKDPEVKTRYEEQALEEIATWVQHCESDNDSYSHFWRLLSDVRHHLSPCHSPEPPSSERPNVDTPWEDLSVDVLGRERYQNKMGALRELRVCMAHFLSDRDDGITISDQLRGARLERMSRQQWTKTQPVNMKTRVDTMKAQTTSNALVSTVAEPTDQTAKPQRRNRHTEKKNSVRKTRSKIVSQAKIVKPIPKRVRTTTIAGPITRARSKSMSNCISK